MNPYFGVGRQDISAHVEFTSVRSAAITAGFAEAGEMSQAEWLRSLGIDGYRAEIAERSGLSRIERRANLHGMDVLVDGEGMGGFRVLAFAKDAPTDGVLGVSPPESCARAARGSAAHAVRGWGVAHSATPPQRGGGSVRRAVAMKPV